MNLGSLTVKTPTEVDTIKLWRQLVITNEKNY